MFKFSSDTGDKKRRPGRTASRTVRSGGARRVSVAPKNRGLSWVDRVDWAKARIAAVVAIFCVLWLGLWGRAWYLQMIEGPRLADKARRQHMATELVTGKRGMIMDRNGQVLARSVEARSVYARPQEIQDFLTMANTLGPILGIEPQKLYDELSKTKRRFVWVRRKVDDYTAEAVRKAGLPGIGLSKEYDRVYPFKHLAGQLLGFVGVDDKGLEGLERSLDDRLAGTPTRMVVQRDAMGRRFYLHEEGKDELRGEDLMLTLDVQLQFIAEEAVARAARDFDARWSGALVVDVPSGDILAWAQYPFFNPNTYRQSSPMIYRNRLAFLSEDNVVMSETGEFFNFFVTTVTTMVDSDVIDVAASNVKSSLLQHAAVFSGGIILFSDQTQFTMEHDTVLANATVSIKPVTEFEADMSAAPVSAGKTVFFATRRGEWGGVREYLTLPDNSDQNDAADVTAHVPRYITGGIFKLICSTNEDLLLVLSRNKRDSIWLYKYYWNGSEKIQSAWSRWDMAGTVLSGAMFESRLYCVMEYDDGIWLEVCDFAPAFKDPGEPIEYCLDRKVTEERCSIGRYDPASKTTTITLPWPVREGLSPLLVTRTAQGQKAGVLLDIVSHGGDTVTVRGDASGKKFFAGIPYRSTYTFSQQAIREQSKGNAITTGRLQLRSMTLNCDDTGYLEMEVTPSFRETSRYIFTGRELGHGTNVIGNIPLYTGKIKVPVHAGLPRRHLGFLPALRPRQCELGGLLQHQAQAGIDAPHHPSTDAALRQGLLPL